MTKFKIVHGSQTIEFSSVDFANAWKQEHGSSAEVVEFIDPQISPTLISALEDTSVPYIVFGSGLFQSMKRKTWALNTYLKLQGSPLTTKQLQALLTTSDMIQKSLETGSLLTAKDVITYLMNILPQYADVGTYAIKEINTFLGIPNS
jgi:hypothetical protein